MPDIMHPYNALPGIPQKNSFIVVDDGGLKLGSASVVEYTNEELLPERPLNYYLVFKLVNEVDSLATDMLLGAVMARSFQLRRRHPGTPARIYAKCEPENAKLLRSLELFGFENDDAKMRMRKSLHSNDYVPPPPVGCVVAPLGLDTYEDREDLLARISRYSLTAKDMDWLEALEQQEFFIVYGVWQDGYNTPLGELILTVRNLDGYLGGFVEMIYTRPEYRGRGVASALIGHAGDRLMQMGIPILNAEVWRRGADAMSLFLKMGFDSAFPIVLYPGINLD